MLKLRHLAAAFAMSALAFSSAEAAQTVKISLTEPAAGGMAMEASPASVPAGPTTFEVRNTGDGNAHEFLIAPLKTGEADVPFNPDTSRVIEDQIADVQELGDLDPGKSGTMTMDLKPGKYLLFCNLPGHYAAGMHMVLTVTQ